MDNNLNNKFADDQSSYAYLIECLGKKNLDSGKTLSETLTINDISYWDVFSPELAWRHLTTCVATTKPLAIIKFILKPFLLPLLERFRRRKIKQDSAINQEKWPQTPTVVCLGFTDYMYRDVLEPVVEQLTKHSNLKVVVLSDFKSSYSEKNHNSKIIFQQVWQQWEPGLNVELVEIKRKLRSITKELLSEKNLYILSNQNNVNISRALKKLIYILMKCYLPLFLRQSLIAKHILNKYRPVAILSPDTSDVRTRVYTLMGKKMSIPSLEVQFGITGEEGIEWRFFSADKVSVWGSSSKSILINHGIPENKIIITGSPRHDILVAPSPSKIQRTRNELGLRDSRPIILLASTYTDKAHEKYVDPEILKAMKVAIFTSAKATPGVTLVVKPHTQECVDETRALAGNAANIIFAERDSDIRNLISICDAFISFGSTATVDALIAEKLCICPVFAGWPFSETFKVSRAVLVPDSLEAINKIFHDISVNAYHNDQLSLDRFRTDFLQSVIYKTDGLASERVRRLLVESLIEKSI